MVESPPQSDLAAEPRAQPPEGPLVVVHDRHPVTVHVEPVAEPGSDPAAADDQDLHHCLLLLLTTVFLSSSANGSSGTPSRSHAHPMGGKGAVPINRCRNGR